MSWMKSAGVNIKKSTSAEGTNNNWKEGDKANFHIDRIAIDSTDNENVVSQHGVDGAGFFINAMLRCDGNKDGQFKNSVIFHKLYIQSENAVRAAADCQFLASYAAIKDLEDPGYYADLIENDQEPDNEILRDLINLQVGVTVGVANFKDGREPTIFVRKISEPFDFDVEEAQASAGGRAGGRSSGRNGGRAGGATGRGRSGASDNTESEPADTGRGRGRGRGRA